MLAVYVGAPFAQAARVREVHKALDELGCKPVSYWADLATEPENLKDTSHRAHRATWQINAESMKEAHVMLALSETTGGGEFFAEVGRFILEAKPVLWVGDRRILSCYAPGVVLENSLTSAMKRLAMAARAGSPSAARDAILARYVGPACPRCKMEGVISAYFPDGSPGWRCRYCDALFAHLERAVAST